ncbi:FirrV-1-B52 [Feldmannia irregularis virus a]|uniref:FirrV-1-B52 n=1 Tax=Feldmannia irregularis virus a TaxID=231992 RepID=Q6XLY4_9PHYC|nr:FirrV-1-B52 [Feldmannia irregularis virus a]AAR26927.1 FirrV-1-B52 [Feldmannia irregularis virus a]
MNTELLDACDNDIAFVQLLLDDADKELAALAQQMVELGTKYDEMIRTAHTMKGVAANMRFEDLRRASGALEAHLKNVDVPRQMEDIGREISRLFPKKKKKTEE